MPINADTGYFVAEQEYQKASTKEEKLKCLKKMLSLAPKHKAAEKLCLELKKKISKLKHEVEKEAKTKKGSRSLSIKKEGAAQISFIGLPNSGKSYVLEKLSGSPVEQKEYPFSTVDPEVRMIDVGGAKLQGIEIPAMYNGFFGSDRGPELLSIVRNSDFVVVVVDGNQDISQQLAVIHDELKKAEIELTENRHEHLEFVMYIPGIVLVNRSPYFGTKLSNLDIFNFKGAQPEEIRQALWAHLPLIRVYTKANSKVASKPVVMKKDSTVRDLAERVHKDFVKNFKYARIWGSGVFPGQQVGMDYVLKDKDVVEIYTN